MAQWVKNPPPMQETRHRRCGLDPWLGKISWYRKWQPTPVFLPEKSLGQRSPVGYSPKGCKELDTTALQARTLFWVCLLLIMRGGTKIRMLIGQQLLAAHTLD